jgi:hypothetical protein
MDRCDAIAGGIVWLYFAMCAVVRSLRARSGPKDPKIQAAACPLRLMANSMI